MKNLITLALILIINSTLISQAVYDRSAMTILSFDFKENHSQILSNSFSKIQPPEKYFFNIADKNILAPNFKRIPVTKGLEFMYFIPDQNIINSLKEQKIGQKILSIWFNRQPDGTFNTEILKERGLYNANDNDLIIASSSKRGTATLMDMGLKLVNQSYIMVFDFFDVMTMEEYYVRKEIPADKRLSNGFKAKVRCYLYKLEFGEAVASEFFQKYWISDTDPDKNKKKNDFDNADFSFEVVSNHYTEVEASQTNPSSTNSSVKQKSQEELMDDLVKTTLENISGQIENKNQELRVKAMVMDTRPIASKIGKKEGLGFDQRYFVFENRMKKDGTVYPKRIAVVKSMKVVDNRTITSGESDPSLFYQIAGRKVDKMGMYLEQKNDAGLNLYLGYNYEGLTGATARLEFYISKFMGDLVGKGKSGKGLTSLKLYIDGGYGSGKYFYESIENEYTFTRVSLGLNKDFYPLKFIHWGPYLGYGLEFAEQDESEDQIESDFVEGGIRVGLNLSYRTQILWSYHYNYLISSKKMDKDKVVLDENFDYKGIFPERMGQGASIGLRFMF
ncbi:MAG: hypothetical protein IPH57_16685 [Saprospiraceae bacterium]|nr:hypothetical protein [Saprospiraceae bacterium]